ncbi:MAG TPA: metallophosphoesterase [Vicinamibacterales bacterium]|nr:metallophosphoesterase [Vicinamibacterales bacterium]
MTSEGGQTQDRVIRSPGRRCLTALVVLLAGHAWISAQEAAFPLAPDSVRFAVIGDNGTGERPQYEVGAQMTAARARFPFAFVLMLGDNMYGRQQPLDFVQKFERPYDGLLQAGVPFYATLGNHDDPDNRTYKGFNMNGARYYTYVRGNVRFVVLDTNALDRAQIAWLENTLQDATEEWKICYFHHPLYSDGGRHGSNVELRVVLEPILVRYGVSVVFAGHEHIYERVVPQKGITHFVEGASGQLRRGDLEPSEMTAAAFDQDQSFMLVEIAGPTMYFQTVSRTGRVVDAGVIRRRPTT